MPWGVSRTRNGPSNRQGVLLHYEGGEKMIMPSEDYLMTGYDPPLNALPISDDEESSVL